MGWGGVFVLMAIESACIPLPSEIIMPLAGWMLVADKGLGWEYILLIGLIGAMGNLAGSGVAYWAGARFGRGFLEHYGKYFLITSEEIARTDHWFQKYGDVTAFFSRLLPAVRTFISLPAGIARMNLKRFFAFSFLGALPWSTGLAWGGYLLGQNWEKIREVMRPFDIPIVIAGVGLVVWFIWSRVRKIRAER
ncbi:DedA family protein [Dehalogenimonas etheniformans]|uniref:DedA family protein n=2 Tax=Dehalogenimonas etheniformans TaxID=1536648 RepID=A0A2P5P771_9CHLR|nr:DedA family protein [Dehalogenimonas etheniformans]PPD58130.1 DedA family protein [Dehalogenimonas etheniformans]QNT75537.1 DedA family protein [Dehalogenimonas etheniformans]